MDQDDSTKKLAKKPAGPNATIPVAEAPPAPTIPDHELIRCIGRGSYGVVWLARSTMGMFRAVKIVYRKSFDHQKPFERELSGIRKFEPISRLHEGFIDVLHIGINEPEGYFYYIMELGDDHSTQQSIDPQNYFPKTLAGEIKRHGKLPAAECLQLGLALSQALADLHQRGLVHRDIKPANIIFVNGSPKLADIGLVADVQEARSYVGTEGFIPPEGPGAPQADVYSLGKVLYEASTGRDRQDFPELPTQWDRATDHEVFLELNEVVLRACKSDPARRYQTAGDLHAELLLLTNGKSIKRLRALERRIANLKRAALVSAAALLIVGFVAFHFYREWHIANEARQQQVGANVAYGNRAAEAGDFSGALPYFADAWRLDRSSSRSEAVHRLRFGAILADCPKISAMWPAGPEVYGVEFSPQEDKVLAFHHFGAAEVFDIQTGHTNGSAFAGEHYLNGAAYSPDGRLIVCAGWNGSNTVWDAATLTELTRFKQRGQVTSVRFSRDGSRIVTASTDGVARIWNTNTWQMEPPFVREDSPLGLTYAAFSDDGHKIVTTGNDFSAVIWDIPSRHRLVLPHPALVNYAAFSPDGKRVVTACNDHRARVWDVETGRRILPDLKHDDGVWSAQFSPDGRWILTASLDHTARLWSAETLEPLPFNPILRHGERVTQAVFGADGNRILTSCADGTIRVWDLAAAGSEPTRLSQTFSRDFGRYLVATNNTITVHDTLSRSAISPLMELGPSPMEAVFNYDGNYILTAAPPTEKGVDNHQTVEIREALTGKRIGASFHVSSTNGLGNVALHKNGKWLATLNGEMIQTWDVSSGKPLRSMNHERKVDSVTFCPDGNTMASISQGVVKIWNVASGSQLYDTVTNVIPETGKPILLTHFEFSPDGSRFVMCGNEPGLVKCSAQIRDTKSGRLVVPPLMHDDGVLWASFSGDGRRVVTAGEDNAAILWDTASGQRLRVFKHGAVVYMAAFSPNDRWVVTKCARSIRIWDAETGDSLTPPLNHRARSNRAMFLGDGSTVVTAMSNGDSAWIWPSLEDKRPLADLELLDTLLSGGMAAANNQSTAASLPNFNTIWKSLREKYPTAFTVSTNELIAWHQRQADESQQNSNRFAIDFHLKNLRALNSGFLRANSSSQKAQASVNQSAAR